MERFKQPPQKETRLAKWKEEMMEIGTDKWIEDVLEQKPTLEEIRELIMSGNENKGVNPFGGNEQKEKIANIIMEQEPNNEDLHWIVKFVEGPVLEKAGKILLNREPSIRQLWNIYFEMKDEQVKKEALLQLKKRENELDKWEKKIYRNNWNIGGFRFIIVVHTRLLSFRP